MALGDTGLPTGATAPFQGVNILKNVFGRDVDPTNNARKVLSSGNRTFDAQLKMLRLAGAVDTDLYRVISSTKKALGKLGGTGDLGKILGSHNSIYDIALKFQNLIYGGGGRVLGTPNRGGVRRNYLKANRPTKLQELQWRAEGMVGLLPIKKPRFSYKAPGGFRRKYGGRSSKINPAPVYTVGDNVKLVKAHFLNRVPQPGDPDFVGPVQEQPGKVGKGKVAKNLLNVARNFIRFPRQQRGGFVSTGGFGNISELEQEEDRVIPSGFIRKQATTQSRALAPTRRNALDMIV